MNIVLFSWFFGRPSFGQFEFTENLQTWTARSWCCSKDSFTLQQSRANHAMNLSSITKYIAYIVCWTKYQSCVVHQNVNLNNNENSDTLYHVSTTQRTRFISCIYSINLVIDHTCWKWGYSGFEPLEIVFGWNHPRSKCTL